MLEQNSIPRDFTCIPPFVIKILLWPDQENVRIRTSCDKWLERQIGTTNVTLFGGKWCFVIMNDRPGDYCD